MNQRLYRSRDERIILGVAGGLGEYFHMDPSLVRILWVVVAFATFGAAVLLYLVIALIVPEEPAGLVRSGDWGRARSGYQWPDQAASSSAPPGAGPPGPAARFVSSTPPSATVPDTPTSPSAPMGTESIPVSLAAPATATTATVTPTAATNAQQAPATAASPRAQARQQRREARAERRAARGDGRGALFWGLLLVLVGGYFVVRTYFPGVDVDRLWPIVAIILGIVLVLGAFRRSPGPTA